MSSTPLDAPEPHGDPDAADKARARRDLIGAAGWIALGLAILIGSITMDRLEAQHINPNTVPGLLPGLLGIAMIILGTILGLRSLRHGALQAISRHIPGQAHVDFRRLFLVLALCLVYGVGLVGHGLPFWLASALFVAVSILALQHHQRKAQGRKLDLRAIGFAAIVGLGAGGVITTVFQYLFLVRLP